MQKLFYILMLAFCAFSCARENDTAEIASGDEAEQYQIYDLSEGGLPLALRIPSGENPKIKAQWNPSFGRMELTDPAGMNLFISEDTLTCKTKKMEIADGIFKIEYIIDTDSLIYYKSTLPDGASPYWHFFASFDMGDAHYNIHNNPLIEFTQKEVKHMTEVAGNICSNEKNP